MRPFSKKGHSFIADEAFDDVHDDDDDEDAALYEPVKGDLMVCWLLSAMISKLTNHHAAAAA